MAYAPVVSSLTRILSLVAIAAVTAAVAAPPAASAHPAPTGTFTDLGTPLSSLTIMQGVLGHDGSGRDVIYAVPAGDNARLNVVDVASRQLLAAVPLPGASGAWGIVVGADGRVYVGTYDNAHLYRYDPATGAVSDLGQPVPGEAYIYGLSAGPDGTIYGGTYPHTHAFAYHPDTGATTDFGPLDGVQQYARSTAYDPDRNALFVGLSSPKARLFRVDVATGTRQEITPTGFTGAAFSDLNYAGGTVFGNRDGSLVTFDAATGAQVPITDAATGTGALTYPISARGVSPAHNGAVYFTTAGSVLVRYDLATRTATRLNAVVSRGAAIAYGWVGDVLYGLAGNYSGGTFSFDTATGALAQWSSPFRYVPTPLINVLAGTDGRVYLSAYLNGQTAVYDPATAGVTQPIRLGQVEDWTWRDGKILAGIYPYGRVTEWDPATTTQRTLFELEPTYDQNRPVDIVYDAGHVYAATTPGYGLYGGALTTYDNAAGTFSVAANIVDKQTVSALAPFNGRVIGGSSVDGGQGTVPVATEARMFRWDPVRARVTATYRPVPGAHSINALEIGPDGLLWGLGDGTLFVAEPHTGIVLRRVKVFDGATGAQDGALVRSADRRHLYGVTGGRLFVVDTRTFRATVLRTGVSRLTMTPDGALYMLYTSPEGGLTHLARYVP
jgi:hypothetical protein